MVSVVLLTILRLNLADMIMKKIEEKKQEVQEITGEEPVGNDLPEELVMHYRICKIYKKNNGLLNEII